ncbi:MAG: hypothetical protein LBD58_10350 [Treponema sp.]|nr:hypothetical protein [Treponema sp.]
MDKEMISSEFKTFLIELLTSWQVIAATIVIALYVALVNYVTHFNPENKRKQPKPKPKVKEKKKEKVKKAHKKNKKEDEEDETLEEEE